MKKKSGIAPAAAAATSVFLDRKKGKPEPDSSPPKGWKPGGPDTEKSEYIKKLGDLLKRIRERDPDSNEIGILENAINLLTDKRKYYTNEGDYNRALEEAAKVVKKHKPSFFNKLKGFFSKKGSLNKDYSRLILEFERKRR